MSFLTFLLPLYLLLAGDCQSYSNTSERVTKSTSQTSAEWKVLPHSFKPLVFFPLPLYWVTINNYHSLSQMHKAMQLRRKRLHFLHIIFVYIVNSSVRWLNSMMRLMCKLYLLECLNKNEIEVEVFIYLFIEKQFSATFFSFHHRRAHKLFKCIFTIFKAFFWERYVHML